MKTQILDINTDAIEEEKIALAASVIRRGGIVAFPTDTVYGLGVDVFNEEAVQKVYSVKGRGEQKPMGILISDERELCDLVVEIPESAKVLMRKFWPGALTLILPAGRVNNFLTASSGTIGVRIPDNRIALSLVRESGVPLTSTSANLSGHASASCVEEVLGELDGKIDLVIDGGSLNSSVPSTVVDLTDGTLRILREGKVSRADIEEAL